MQSDSTYRLDNLQDRLVNSGLAWRKPYGERHRLIKRQRDRSRCSKCAIVSAPCELVADGLFRPRVPYDCYRPLTGHSRMPASIFIDAHTYVWHLAINLVRSVTLRDNLK